MKQVMIKVLLRDLIMVKFLFHWKAAINAKIAYEVKNNDEPLK